MNENGQSRKNDRHQNPFGKPTFHADMSDIGKFLTMDEILLSSLWSQTVYFVNCKPNPQHGENDFGAKCLCHGIRNRDIFLTFFCFLIHKQITKSVACREGKQSKRPSPIPPPSLPSLNSGCQIFQRVPFTTSTYGWPTSTFFLRRLWRQYNYFWGGSARRKNAICYVKIY